jgi:hypothetical protein
MNRWSLYDQPAELIPFSLGEYPGTVAVFYASNQEPSRVGYDYLAGASFDPDGCRGYPVIHARLEDYHATGVRAFLGWLQIITSLYTSSHDPQTAQTETFTTVDVAPSLADSGFPFYAFGSYPQLFDAPCRNLGDRATLAWTADTFLTTFPLRSKRDPVTRLAGFRWGYSETDIPGQRPILLPLEVTGCQAWNQHLPFLAKTYPTWNFQSIS